jgi:hypothetical protein
MVAVVVAVAVAVATAVPVFPGGIGIGPAPASAAIGPLLTVVARFQSTHFQTGGQSESVVQLATLDTQEPGKEVVVVHTGAVEAPASDTDEGGGEGRAPAPPVPDEEDEPPPEAEPDPEHMPIVVGWHTKPLPQSASPLQASCHL